MRTTKLSPSSKPNLVMRARIRKLMSGRLRSDSVTASPQVGRAGQAMDVLSMLSRSTTSLHHKRQNEHVGGIFWIIQDTTIHSNAHSGRGRLAGVHHP